VVAVLFLSLLLQKYMYLHLLQQLLQNVLFVLIQDVLMNRDFDNAENCCVLFAAKECNKKYCLIILLAHFAICMLWLMLSICFQISCHPCLCFT
jgi:hypothetical protein